MRVCLFCGREYEGSSRPRLYCEATAGRVPSGPDRFVFTLIVLPDQRGHGVGAAVMARAVAGAERSVLVNTDEEDGPVDLYRRWGFTDEVYRRITYRRVHR